MKWVILVTAPDQLTAELWRELLQESGIPAMLQAGDAVSFLGVSAFPCRLLVPEDRYTEAQGLLDELSAAAPLEEESEEAEEQA